MPHLHEAENDVYKARLRYHNNSGTGYYQFSLNVGSNSPITFNDGTITFYTSYDRSDLINKLSTNNYTLQAKSIAGANNIVLYLENGDYFFDVILDTDNINELTLTISSFIVASFDLFTLNENADDTVDLLQNSSIGDYFNKINLKQTGKFEINAQYENDCSETTYILITRIIENNNSYSLDIKLVGVLNGIIPSITTTVILEPDIYYIGYFNKTSDIEVIINFKRKITQSGSSHLVADAIDYDDYGSEVRFNNGLRGGTTLTVGFTRFIYLDDPSNVPSISRLNYYWYTSNEEVATISEYGTLLAKSPGTVKVMAVYKSNPSITYVKEFTVLADNRINDLIIYDTDSVTYSSPSQLYQIELDDYNSYFPQISLYNWNILSSTNNYTISEW